MKYSIFVIFFLLVFSSHGQSVKDSTENKEYGVPLLAVKWSPLHLINTYPTFHLDAEVRLFSRISIQVGGAPVIRLNQFTKERNRRGVKLKSEVRYYIIAKKNMLYLAPSFDYNRLKRSKPGTFGFDCANGICSYYQNTRFVRVKTVHAVAFRMGWQRYIGSGMLLDLNAGLGFRWGGITREGEPEGYDRYLNDFNEGWFNFDNGNVVESYALVLGIKLGVKIK